MTSVRTRVRHAIATFVVMAVAFLCVRPVFANARAGETTIQARKDVAPVVLAPGNGMLVRWHGPASPHHPHVPVFSTRDFRFSHRWQNAAQVGGVRVGSTVDAFTGHDLVGVVELRI